MTDRLTVTQGACHAHHAFRLIDLLSRRLQEGHQDSLKLAIGLDDNFTSDMKMSL
jgi:hypothetical protein